MVKQIYFVSLHPVFQMSIGSKNDTLTIANPGTSNISLNGMMYYSPRYPDYHRSNLGIFAFNLEKIFPCIAGKNIDFNLRCRRFTLEEDGFNKGRAILEIGDGGNHLGMFGRKPVYAFAVQDCSQLTRACLPYWWQTSITCLLPRKFCAS